MLELTTKLLKIIQLNYFSKFQNTTIDELEVRVEQLESNLFETQNKVLELQGDLIEVEADVLENEFDLQELKEEVYFSLFLPLFLMSL